MMWNKNQFHHHFSSKNPFQTVLPLIFSILFILIPWDYFQGKPFYDLQNYINYFSAETPFFELGWLTPGQWISKEIFWHYILFWMVKFFHIDAVFFLKGISFVSIFAMASFLVSRHGLLSLLLLVNPIVVDFCCSQLRLAFAMALLLLALRLQRRWVCLLLVLCAIATHTAAIIIIAVYLGVTICSRLYRFGYLGKWSVITLTAVLGFGMSVIFGPLLAVILSMFDDSRGIDYPDMSSTLKYLSFWIGLLVFALVRIRDYRLSSNHLFAMAALFTVFFNVFVDGYSTRVIAFAFPFIMSLMLSFLPPARFLALTVFFCYACVQWYYWLELYL